MRERSFPARVVVVGTGLIGTSAALALRQQGAEVWLADIDSAAAHLAADLGAGELLPAPGGVPEPPPSGPADVAVVAVPPSVVPATLARAQARGLARCYTDTASVKALPLAQAREAGCDISRYVPGHPLAGSERSGPAAARGDLFLGRPWALCPAPDTAERAVRDVTALVLACGAEPVVADAAEHDGWVALVSHAPHVVAAAMAAQLSGESVPGRALTLAGQGLRDTTRIAAGEAELWTQILAGNAAPVASVLGAVAADLAEASRALTELAAETAPPAHAPRHAGMPGGHAPGAAAKRVAALLERGRTGAGRIPGKRGVAAREFSTVQIVIADRPGELARLLAAAGEAGVNVEDVGIEHSPGLPVGVAELAVLPEAASRLVDVLAAAGWPARR